jgi:type IV pilus assembly protein PilV
MARRMHPSGPGGCRSTRGDAGVAMIEALIGMVLIALLVLSTAGLQVSSLQFQRSAGNRFLAVALAGELGESLEANNAGALAGSYALAAVTAPVTSSTDCTAVYCTPAQLSRWDLAQWTTRVAGTIPVKDMSVLSGTSPSGLVTYTIRISWTEPKGRQAYADGVSDETLSFVLTKVVRGVS